MTGRIQIDKLESVGYIYPFAMEDSPSIALLLDELSRIQKASVCRLAGSCLKYYQIVEFGVYIYVCMYMYIYMYIYIYSIL